MSEPCGACQTVHGSDAAVAVGRFDPKGVLGYRSRTGGPLRTTRVEAEADFCQTQAARSSLASDKPCMLPACGCEGTAHP